RGLDSGGDCRRAAMNTVKAVGVHVVRKARRAADAGNKNRLLARDAQVGHDLLHVVENRVIAATGTPTHFLVRNEIFLRQLSRRRRDMKKRSASFTFSRDARVNMCLVSVVAVTVTCATNFSFI